MDVKKGCWRPIMDKNIHRKVHLGTEPTQWRYWTSKWKVNLESDSSVVKKTSTPVAWDQLLGVDGWATVMNLIDRGHQELPVRS